MDDGMPRFPRKDLIFRAVLLTWLVTSIFLFFFFVGRFAYEQLFIFTGWQFLSARLERIDFLGVSIDIVGALAGVIIFSLSCLSFGMGILHAWIRKFQPSPLALGVTAFLSGEIFYSLLFLAIISLYQLTPVFVGLSLLIGFLAGFPAIKSYTAQLARPSTPNNFSMMDKIILGLGIAVFVLCTLYSSTLLGYDAVVEYFSNPKLMAISQQVNYFNLDDSLVVSAFHPGVLFTALIQLFGDQSARLLPWVNGLAIILMGLAIGEQLGLTFHARLWFLVIVLTTTAFMDPLGDGKIELICTAPIIAAVYWMVYAIRSPSSRVSILIGFFLGFAIISRSYNIFLVGLFTALFYSIDILMKHRTGRDFIKQFVTHSLWLSLPILVLGVFHLGMNWLLLGNPLAPLQFFKNLDHGDWQWMFDPANLPIYRIFYPLTLTFFSTPQSLGTISPLFVGFLPFVFIRSIRNKLHISHDTQLIIFSSIITLLPWVWFFFTVVEIRYVLFIWLLMFLPVAQLIDVVIRYSGSLIQPIIKPLLVILLTYTGLRLMGIFINTYAPIDDKGQPHCYDVNICTFIDVVNRSAAPGSRVFVINSYRYYLRPDLFVCSSRSEETKLLGALALQDSPDFWVEAYRLGYRYVTYEEHYAIRHARFGPVPDPAQVPPWLDVVLISDYKNSMEKVYRIDSRNPIISVETYCRQDSTGNWELVPLKK